MSGARPPLRQLEIEDLRNLSISDQNELYWKGERVEVKSRLSLTKPQTVGAIILGVAAVLGGLGALASGVNDGTEFTCRQWHYFCGHERAAESEVQPTGAKSVP